MSESRRKRGRKKTIEWKRAREKKSRMEKGANQKSECTRICYDRRMTTVEGKEKAQQKNNKCRTKASDELNTLWGLLAACRCSYVHKPQTRCVIGVVVQFKRNAFCSVLVNLIFPVVETSLTDLKVDRAIKICRFENRISPESALDRLFSLRIFFVHFLLPVWCLYSKWTELIERYNKVHLYGDG